MEHQPQHLPPPDPGYQAAAPLYAANNDPARPPAYYQGQHLPPAAVPAQNAYYPLQRQIDANQVNAPVTVDRCLGCIFTLAAVLMALFSFIVVLFLHWVQYCRFDMGLVNFTDGGNTYGIANSEHSFFCDEDLEYSENIANCGDICSNSKKLRDGGSYMNLLGLITVGVVCALILRMLILIFRPTRTCGVILIRITLVTATIFWLIGVCVYLSYYASVKDNCSDTSMEEGLILAIIIAILFVGSSVLGNLAIRKIVR